MVATSMISESGSLGTGEGRWTGELDVVWGLALCHPGQVWELPAGGESRGDMGRDILCFSFCGSCLEELGARL